MRYEKFDAATSSFSSPISSPRTVSASEENGIIFRDLNQLAQTIHKHRISQNLSIHDAAIQAQVTQKSIKDCENGKVIPIDALQNIFDTLGIYDLLLPEEYA